MLPNYNYTTDSIEDLYAGIHQFGNTEQKREAYDLLNEHNRLDEKLGAEREVLRNKMMILMAKADWEFSTTEEAKNEKHQIFRENFKIAS